MTGIKHYELRHGTDYIAKLRENTDTRECSEVVFYRGEPIHSATFPSLNLGGASRGEYLECMAHSIAREHRQAK
jgi:hypothetical protein